jgi:hypothetical protein
MAVRDDCRHYSSRTLPSGDKRESCKLGVNEDMPFACPDGCLFFEPRFGSGWVTQPS